MSKEMLVIALGAWTALVTQLGVPGSWKMAALFLTGIAVAVVGFLLRGESLSRAQGREAPRDNGRPRSSFVESSMPAGALAPDTDDDQRNGINSLN